MTSWDERYGAADYYYGTEANEFLRENCSKIRRGGDVLCLAEGEGGATGRSKGSADPYGPRQPRWLPYRTDAVGWHRVHLVPFADVLAGCGSQRGRCRTQGWRRVPARGLYPSAARIWNGRAAQRGPDANAGTTSRRAEGTRVCARSRAGTHRARGRRPSWLERGRPGRRAPASLKERGWTLSGASAEHFLDGPGH